MSRQINLIIVTSIVTVLALLLGLQLREPDSFLMRYWNSSHKAASKVLHVQHARRAFTPFASPQPSSFSTTSITMVVQSDATAAPTNGNTGVQDTLEDADAGGQPLGLPPPPSEGDATKLDMSSGSDTVKLDHLGPLVVNKDGTLSRISNWEQMTEQERKSTLRILGKRNQLRTDALKAAGEG